METEKDLRPVEEKGSVESKLSQNQSLFGQRLGETSGMSSFSENCSGSVLVAEENGGGNGGEIDVNSEKPAVCNVELNKIFSPGPNDFGVEGVENEEEPLLGVAVVEEIKFSLDSSVTNIEKGIMAEPHNNSDNGDGLRTEEVSAVEGSEEIGTENVVSKEDLEEANDAMKPSEVDSSRKFEITGDGISLFVEVFGPLDGANQADAGNSRDKHVLREGDSDQDNEINGALASSDGEDGSAKVSEANDSKLHVKINSSAGDKVDGLNKMEGEDFGNKESTFVVGDLVWAKSKTQLWWPGVISNPSNTSKGPVVSNKQDSFLVKYFGNANFIWYSSSQLKHLLEDFDQMCQQNKSRSFRGAVERAICEIGRRVKVEMTCSCFSRENQTSSVLLADQTMQRYSCSENKMGESRAFSRSQFQPASFLALIKYLAQSACLTDKIKLTATQNCLSAVYRSLGHHQFHMQQLRPTDPKDSAHNGTTRSSYLNDEVDGGKFTSSASSLKIGEGKESCTVEAEVFTDCELASSKVEQLSPLKSPKPTKGALLNGENNGKVVRRSRKGNESRERKRSKYLSYPYIDLKKGDENAAPSGEKESEDFKKGPDLGVRMNNNSSQSNGGKKSQKSGSRNSSCHLDTLGKAKDISSSSAEILSELQLTALDCLYAKGRKLSGSVSSFLFGFRRFAFLNIEIDNEHIGDSKEGKTVPSNHGSEGRSRENAVGHTSSSVKPKKRQRRKEDRTSVGTVVSGVIRNAISGSVVTKCQGVGSHTPKSKKVPRKIKKVGTDFGMPENEPATGLPDLNGNMPASSFEDNQATESTAFHHELGLGPKSSCSQTSGLLDPGRNSIKFVQLLKDVQSMGPSFLNSFSQQNYMKGETPFASEANGNSLQPMSPAAKSECRKRKRKEKTLKPPNTIVTSSIPDLNGNAADTVSPGNSTPDMKNSASDKGKLPRKRKKNKPTAAVPNTNANQNSIGVSVPSSTTLAQPLLPMDGLKTTRANAIPPPGSTTHNADPPDLLFIKTNLEMMKSTLEKAGNSLSPEMRSKLENEIKSFMKRISSMVASSSS